MGRAVATKMSPHGNRRAQAQGYMVGPGAEQEVGEERAADAVVPRAGRLGEVGPGLGVGSAAALESFGRAALNLLGNGDSQWMLDSRPLNELLAAQAVGSSDSRCASPARRANQRRPSTSAPLVGSPQATSSATRSGTAILQRALAGRSSTSQTLQSSNP